MFSVTMLLYPIMSCITVISLFVCFMHRRRKDKKTQRWFPKSRGNQIKPACFENHVRGSSLSTQMHSCCFEFRPLTLSRPKDNTCSALSSCGLRLRYLDDRFWMGTSSHDLTSLPTPKSLSARSWRLQSNHFEPTRIDASPSSNLPLDYA